jgi:hypothetical protein
MQNRQLTNQSPRSVLLAACAVVGLGIASSAYAAGLAPATSTYITIQPNGAGTHTVYTLSWVAPDSDQDGNGLTDAYIPSFGNANAKLDNANNLQGGDLFSGTQGIQYIHNAVNNTTEVQWTDPANYTIGVTNPVAIAREWRNLGGFGTDVWSSNVMAFGSGEGGVTGVFSTNPNGTGAATGTGVGINYDWNSSTSTDFGFLLSGVSATPNTGYVQVSIPNPTVKWNDPANGDFTSVPYAFNLADKFISGTYTTNGAVELVVTTDAAYVPKKALSGDFDGDQSIGNSDIGVVFGNFGQTGKWYADGDTDADGAIGNSDIGVVFGGFGTSASISALALTAPEMALAGNVTDSPTLADLVYDPSTGNVTLDASEASGSVITNYVLRNGTSSFAFANFTPVLPGVFDTKTATEISESDGSGAGVGGLLNLGNIFPTGMTVTQLQSYLTTASYVGQLGSGVQTLDLTVIPEPTTLALLGLGGLLCGRRRRAA